VLFDGRCGFCTRCRDWVQQRDPAGSILAVPNQTPGLRQQFGLSRSDVDRQLWAISRTGGMYGGAAACVLVLRELGGIWAALAHLYRLPGVPWCAARLYALVARHRGRLARWGATPACERTGVECEP
jgi:predicted DCC family thiol-disulfide oxidoreductase YuxK